MAAVLVAVVAGCDWSELVLVPAENEGVTRPGLSATVVVEAEHAALAEALGWPDGVVPDAQVAVAPRGAEFEWEEATSDSEGIVRFPDLLPGRYSITAYRALTAEERAALVAVGIDARVLGGGGILTAPTGAEDRPLHVQPDEPGSLVISELSSESAEIPPGSGTNYHSAFIELYNASDTTIYLDGKIIGEAGGSGYDYPNFPCSLYEHIRNRPDAVVVLEAQAFPGTGQDYPIEPGEVVMIASEAIDHSQFGPYLVDMSGADFEFSSPGNTGADNPHVPNMINIGSRWIPRGIHFTTNATAAVVADALDPETLERVMWPEPNATGYYLAIPGANVLDLLATRLKWIAPSGAAPCDQLVHSNFDGLEAVLVPQGWADGRSLQRRVAGIDLDGRVILQRTRTSMVDLFYGAWTPYAPPPADSGVD